jgi:hypothetical protein
MWRAPTTVPEVGKARGEPESGEAEHLLCCCCPAHPALSSLAFRYSTSELAHSICKQN